MKRAGVRERRALDHAEASLPLILDQPAREAVDHFVRVLGRCGYAPEEIARAVLASCGRIPRSWRDSQQTERSDMYSFGRILTLWFSDPSYLDQRGSPRALPLRGAVSLDALARRSDPHADIRKLLRYPLRSGVLRKSGNRYLPNDRRFLLRGAEGLSHPHGLRGLFGLLKTLDHNRARSADAPVRLQLFSYNEQFPVRARADFEKRISETCSRVLYRFDGEMHSRERLRRKGEPTILMGVGMYLFEEKAPAEARREPGKRVRRRARERP